MTMDDITMHDKSLKILPQLNQLYNLMSISNLDGSSGSNRYTEKKPQIRAQNDYEAIQCWLNEYKHKETTFRTYQKEVERFLLWCIYQEKTALSSMDRDNLEDYINFLNNPSPKEVWCSAKGGRGHKRGSLNWRPFTGPLSTSAKMTALSVIDSLFSYLVDARYLSFNPLSLIKKRKLLNARVQDNTFKIQERILEIDEWHALLDTLDNLPDAEDNEKNEKERLRLLVSLLYFLGLRINELASHTWNSFRKSDDLWWFFVFGKGDKLAKIPVNNELLRIIISYRAFLNKSPLPTTDDTSPLIVSLDRKNAITARQMNKLLKKLAIQAANKFIYQPEKKKKLKKFSAHWLRHLSASMQDHVGISFKHVRSNLRHENDDTTRLYVHAIDEERHCDMQKLKLRILP
jgi:site-specific recombinase XerD